MVSVINGRDSEQHRAMSSRGINPYHTKYYISQSGGALPVYRGSPYQRGYGIGGFLSGVARSILPTILPAVKNTVLKHGMGFVGDLLKGRNIKDAAKARAMAGGADLLGQVVSGASGAIKRKAGGGFSRSSTAAKAPRRAAPARKRKKARRKTKSRDVFS